MIPNDNEDNQAAGLASEEANHRAAYIRINFRCAPGNEPFINEFNLVVITAWEIKRDWPVRRQKRSVFI